MSDSPLPDWPEVRLGDHATVKARLGWKGLKAEEYILDGPIFIAAPNLRRGSIDFDNVDHIPQWRYEESPEIQLTQGDVLLVKDGSTLGISSIVKELPAPSTVNGSIAVIRPRTSLASGFLYYSINGQHFQRLVWLKRSGLGVPHLFQADLRELKISLPPLPEQCQIAEILSTLDEAIAQTEALIAKHQQIKTGLMHELFTRGVTPNGCFRPSRIEAPCLYEKSPMGWIPKEWHVRDLASVSQLITSGSRSWANYYSDTGPLFLRIGNLTREHINFRWESVARVCLPRATEGQRTAALPNDIVISITADLALVGVAGTNLGETYVNQHLALVRLKEPLKLSRFLAQFLMTPRGQKQFLRLNDSGAKAGLNLPTVGKVLVAMPRYSEEAEQVSKIVDDADENVAASKQQLIKLCELKHGLMHDLLTGRIRVKIEELAST